MSGIGPIGIYNANHTALELFTGEKLTGYELGRLKVDPRYSGAAANPLYRAGVDRLHQLADHQREQRRLARWMVKQGAKR